MATANNLGTAYIRIAPQMQGIQSTITRQLAGVGGSAGTEFANNFASKYGKAAGVIAGITSAVVSKAASAVTNSLDQAINRVDTLNVFPKIMKNLGFEAEESSSAMQKLSDRIEGLPTTLDEITIYTQRLASTMGDLDKGYYSATNLAIAFNDAALAGGKGQYEANRAFEQFAQVLSRGRPSMQDWKIMMEVMPGQLKQIAKYMGSNNKSLQAYAKNAKKTVDELDGMDLYNWISEDKNEHAKERLNDLTKALVDLDNKGGEGITAFKDQVGDATHTIGTALRLIPVRIAKALAQVIQAFGSGDIYNALDKFTSGFKDVGDFIVQYIVPPIKSEVIPTLKNIIKGIGDVIKWVAKTESVRKTLGELLKAFIAFKVITAITSTIKAFVLVIAGSIATLVKGVSVVKTFTGVITAGDGLSAAFGAAKAQSTAFAAANGSLTKSMEIAGISAGKLIGTLTIGLGAIVAAVLSVDAALKAVDISTKKAETSMRLYTSTVVNQENAQRHLNKSIELEGVILDELEEKRRLQNDAEYQMLSAKKRVKELQDEYNKALKEGSMSAEELRLRELELNAAKYNLTDAMQAYNASVKETKRVQEDYLNNTLTAINEENKLRGIRELEKGDFATLAQQMDELSTKTIMYKDENGKMVAANKAKTKEMIDYYNSEFSRVDAIWAKVVKTAEEEGITFSEACKKVGTSGAKGLVGNFTKAADEYQPLATKVGENLASGVKGGIFGKINEVVAAGKTLVSNVLEKMRKTADEHSPSKITTKYGEYLSIGLANGIKNAAGAANKAAEDAMQGALDKFNGGVDFSLNGTSALSGANAALMQPAQGQGGVTQYNTFNQVADDLDVKEASRKLGWEVATAI